MRPSRSGLRAGRNGSESRLDLAQHRRAIEVADDDDRHVVGTIPLIVEAADRGGGRALDQRRVADRLTERIARVAVEHRVHVILVALRCRVEQTHAPLAHHDAALRLHFVRVDRDAAAHPIAQHREPAIENLSIVGGQREHVDGFVLARERVQVRAEAHPARLDEVDEITVRKVRRPVERHVLEEVREPALIFILEQAARVHREPKLDAMRGHCVGAQIVAKPVGERARR